MDLKNIQYVYVAGAVNRQATTVTDKSSATYIADGEIVVTDLAGTVLDTDAASYTKEKVKIVYRKGDTIISSPAISYKNVKFYDVKGYAAKVNQISYIGYNGTSGTLEGGTLVAATDYIVTLRKHKVISGMTDSYYDNKSAQWYNESATSGQYLLADGLIAQLIANFNADFQIDNYIKFERVASTSGSLLGGSSTLKVTTGSKTVIASSGSHGLVAGDYVRIGSQSGTTFPVYKVASVNSTTILLDVPYQGTSGTIANANIGKVGTPTSANWGIKITGNDHTFEAGRWRNDVFAFDITLTNFDNTITTLNTQAYIGNGTYADVAEREWYAFAADALPFAEYNMPPRVKNLKASSSLVYNWVVLSAFDNDYSNIHSRPESPFEILIAIPRKSSSDQGEAAGSSSVAMGVVTALDTWLTTMTGTTISKTSKLV